MLQTQAMPLILQTKLQTKQKTAAKTPQKIPATLLMNQTATKADAPRGHRPPVHNPGPEGWRFIMNYQIISEKTLSAFLRSEHILLLDLRSREDYAKGHIPGAVWLDWEHACEDFPVFLENFEKSNKTPPAHVVMYCDSGHISLITARDLAVRGYPVMSLNGGFHRWHGETVS